MKAAPWKLGWIVLGLLATVLLPGRCLGTPKPEIRTSAEKVGRYEKIEFRFVIGFGESDEQAEVTFRLQTPSGKRLTIPAFYWQNYERRRLTQGNRQVDWMLPTGPPVWQARFAPAELGTYRATARLRDSRLTAESEPIKFECIPSARKGFLRISQKDPRFFEFSEGQPFFAIGQNLAFIGETQYMNLAKTEDVFATLSQNGANYLRIWTCCEDWAMAIEARKSAFGRSWAWKPPFATLPDAKGPDRDRKYVKLTGNGTTLAVSPSHPVALRPKTPYLFTARVKTDGDAAVRFESALIRIDKSISSGPDHGWVDVKQKFEAGPNDFWLGPLNMRLSGTGTAWIHDLSLQYAPRSGNLLSEADPNRPVLGNFNQFDSFMLDEIVAAAEKNGIYLQLCLITRDLYMGSLKNDKSPEYDKAIADAKKFMRYAVARWGYSTNVAAWEYFNEIDPGLPTDRFYTELGEYLEQIDVYHHLRTTSTWHPSPKDMRHPKLDIADLHNYFRPADRQQYKDEVDALLDRTRFLRENAPSKPAHLGEFGLANDKFQPTEEMKTSDQVIDFHNALWASSLSGASGTCLFWWWDRLDQRNAYGEYRPLGMFLADIPWTTAGLRQATATVANGQARLVGLQGRQCAYLWLFNPQAAWASVVIQKVTPAAINGATVEIKDLAPGAYRVQWWDTREGKVLREDKAAAQAGTVRLSVPAFDRDIACKIVPQSAKDDKE